MNPNINGNFNNGNMPPQASQMSMEMINQLMASQPITGPKGGTPISSLKNLKPLNQMPNMQHPMQYSPQNHANMQAQANAQAFQAQQQNKQYPKTQETDQDQDDDDVNPATHHIRHLVKDINRSLDDYVPSKKLLNTEENEEETESDKSREKKDKDDDIEKFLNPSFALLKECLLLLIIYIILSQSFVKKTVGKYISYINSNSDGSHSIIGIIIYGTILALIFILFRKIFLRT